MPLNPKTCRNIRFHTLNDKRPRILVTNSKRNIKNIYFSLPYYVRVCDTTKIVLSLKLRKFETYNIIMNIESHASHPSLPALLEGIKLGFQCVHVNNPETYNLIIVEGKPAEIPPSTPNHLTVNKINTEKTLV